MPPDQQSGDLVDLGAVYSLTFCYYMETGLLGGLALLAVLAMVLRAIARSSAIVLGFCTLGTWLVGVAVTTSYMPLSAIWLFLGALLSWDRLFPTRPDPTRHRSGPSTMKIKAVPTGTIADETQW